MAIPSFVDQVTLHTYGGNGGHGCASVHREKFKPLGGPDGGNGGSGGSVILRVDASLTTLVDYHRQSHRKALSGQPGKGDHNNGATGENVILPVPDGTVVSDADTGERLADLTGDGAELVVAQGGRGGLGNAALASTARKAPGFALLGEEGETRIIVLELKVVADVGLVGFPSAGKSSLVAAISRARPKIADYPFTTLEPNLGVVEVDDHTFVMADIPGLLEGAALGVGLGIEFLRHVERTRILIHVLDGSGGLEGNDPLVAFDTINAELKAYGEGIDEKPQIVAINKLDIPEAQERLPVLRAALEERGYVVVPISAATGQGVRDLMRQVYRELVANPIVEEVAPEETGPRRYTLDDETDEEHYEVERMSRHHFSIQGIKIERLAKMTDFGNDEASERFQRVLQASGIVKKLDAIGIEEGDTVHLAGIELLWGEQEGEADRTRAGGRHRRRE